MIFSSDFELAVPIMLCPLHSPADVGLRVMGNYQGLGSWYSGIVSESGVDGTYSITYDDGDAEICVPPERMRLIFDGNTTLFCLLKHDFNWAG